MGEFHYHNTVTLGAPMTWFQVARSTGFDDPGPILAYPPNIARWRTSENPDGTVAAGREVLIPFKTSTLERMIAAARSAITDSAIQAEKLIAMVKADGDQINRVFATADIAAAVIGAFASIGVGISQAGKAAQAPISFSGAAAEEEVLVMLKDGIAPRVSNIVTTITPTPDPAGGSGAGHWFKLIVRHTLGPWNPSFWASVALAIKEDNADIYIYGMDAFTAQQTRQIANQAKAQIGKWKEQIKDMAEQKDAAFNRVRM